MTEHRHPREIAKEINEPTIAELATAVEDARRELANARDREQRASRETIEATNHYNQVTKALDAAIVKLKTSAPQGTDWAESQRLGTSE